MAKLALYTNNFSNRIGDQMTKQELEAKFNRKINEYTLAFEYEESIDTYWDAVKQLKPTWIKMYEALEFSLHCVRQTPWIKEGPGDIHNPMFLGTGSREGDQKIHEQYLAAEQTLTEAREFLSITKTP